MKFGARTIWCRATCGATDGGWWVRCHTSTPASTATVATRHGAQRGARAHERIACRIAAFSRAAGIGPLMCGGTTFPAAVTKKVSG